MKVQIVGVGRVGGAFAEFLRRRGYEVRTYRVRAKEGELEDADLLFIGTKDDLIGSTAAWLHSKGLRYRVVGHFSGALTSDVLSPFPERFSFHPLQAFNRPDPCLWEGITVGFEGTERAAKVVREFVAHLPIRLVEIRPEDKPLYHAAAVFVSNLIYAPLVAGEEIFSSLRLNREDYARLIKVAFNNFLLRGIEGLTGPIVRRDESTLQRHREVLEERGDLKDLYDVLTEFLKKRLFSDSDASGK